MIASGITEFVFVLSPLPTRAADQREPPHDSSHTRLSISDY